jgi:uroporphyrinogen-III synthase
MAESARPRIALLESRMSHELARLVEKHGGDPVCVPAVRESPELSPESLLKLIEDLRGDRHEIVIFMTGVAVSLLFEVADQVGKRPDLVAALKRLTTVCRGPKPTAALRGFGVPPTLTAREPFTSAELIDALAGIELKGRRVILLHYGERSETLAETLLARQAQLDELWLYRWLMPEDTSPLASLVQRMIDGEIEALTITCQIQFRHLMAVAEAHHTDRDLVRALNDKVVVAAVGPTCAAVLRAYGVRVQVMPDHPKMGPLVISLLRHLELGARGAEAALVERPRVTH